MHVVETETHSTSILQEILRRRTFHQHDDDGEFDLDLTAENEAIRYISAYFKLI